VSEHVFDELPALLTGELDRQATAKVSAHLRACDDCRQDLVMVVSASAALRAAGRVAPELVTTGEVTLPDPTKLLAEITGGGEGASDACQATSAPAPSQPGLDGDGGSADGGQPPATAAPVGDTSVGDTSVGDTSVGDTSVGDTSVGDLDVDRSALAGPPVEVRRQARRRLWWSAAAAGVLLLAGAGAGVLVRDRATRATPSPSVGRQVALAPAVGPWAGTGSVTMSGGTMTVDPKKLRAAPPGHFYEVWLVNGKSPVPKLLPVGVLSASDPSQYRLGQDMLAKYNTVAVSFERDDGNPEFSGVSVMSGQYN
jgi:hypothetical protein